MANNCTLSMAAENVSVIKTAAWKELQAADFAFDCPFHLPMNDGQSLFVEKIVRLIPQRRMVVFGRWQGKLVAGKLFFDKHHAKKHCKKELIGVEALQLNKIPSPALYLQTTSADKRVEILLFERIDGAKNLDELWRDKTSVEELIPLLKAVVIELATQHVLGVLQHDLHLKNFLIKDKHIYTLDGSAIEVHPHLLPKKISMRHLALFFSQLGIEAEQYHKSLFQHYAKSRGWLLKKDDYDDFFATIKNYSEYRWQRYMKKIFRACSDYIDMSDWRALKICQRRYTGEEWLAFLKNPESAFAHSSVRMLKAGRSSTVVKLVLDGHELVVKRYNIKNIWHYLRRCLRPTRAAECWRLAHKLKLFGLPTAEPVAFIENRFLGLRGGSYYVTEYVDGDNIADFFERNQADETQTNLMINRVKTLFNNLMKLAISHGDLKKTNILLDQHQRPLLIDLDGAIEHTSPSTLRRTWRKEIKRFLKNFDTQPRLRERFEEVI